MELFYSLFKNLSEKINYLKLDFIVSLDPSPIFLFISNITFAFLVILISYIIGSKLKDLIYKHKIIYYDSFISIALGYIFIGSCIALLGFFSVLNREALYLFFIILILLTIIPRKFFLVKLNHLINDFKNIISDYKKNRLVLIGIALFIFIALINLINPEIREDQYHVDFPVMYLKEQTIMIEPKEDLHVSGSSMLSQMYYIPGIFLLSKESARYIHFVFYLLVILALINFSKIKNYHFAIYSPLIFVSAPVVIHETSSMYVDFQWIFLFVLSILIIVSNKFLNARVLFVCGIFLGGMLATKLWTIALIPVFIIYVIYLKRRVNPFLVLRQVSVLITSIFLVSMLWFIRAYLLTNNPFFPAFHTFEDLGNVKYTYDLMRYFAFNASLINPIKNINVYSPFLYIGILLLTLNFKNNLKIIKSNHIFYLLFLTFIVYITINYPYGRYLLGIYILFVLLASLGIHNALNKSKWIRYGLYGLLLIEFSYYLASSILILPYSFAVADKNKYLSRVLIRDNSSYYDFDYKFDKYINDSDKVAMYNFHGYFYADFNWVDVNFIFNKNNKSFQKLRESGITKIMIRGGDVKWFCEKINVTDCTKSNYSLISSYLQYPYYYLYNIK